MPLLPIWQAPTATPTQRRENSYSRLGFQPRQRKPNPRKIPRNGRLRLQPVVTIHRLIVRGAPRSSTQAKRTGIKIIAKCAELDSIPETTVRELTQHPSLAGYFFKDEPSYGHVRRTRRTRKACTCRRRYQALVSQPVSDLCRSGIA